MPSWSNGMSVCRIYHRHTRQHKLTGKGQFLSCAFSLFHFPIPRSLSFLLWLSRTVSWVKENHVILFICNYQSQTPCKQIGQAGDTCSSNAASAHVETDMQLPHSSQESSVPSLWRPQHTAQTPTANCLYPTTPLPLVKPVRRKSWTEHTASTCCQPHNSVYILHLREMQ